MDDTKNSYKIKLDYNLATPEERIKLVNQIINNPDTTLNSRYLEILADYIIDAETKEEKKENGILTPNRMVTIRKRETSYEGLVSKFENGEDGVYNLITDNKNILLTPKISISKKDIEEIPGLKELRKTIEYYEELYKTAKGKNKFLIKKTIIELRKDQQALKDNWRQPQYSANIIKNLKYIPLEDKKYIDENGEPQDDGLISFFNPKHISALLCNYWALKKEIKGKYYSDSYQLIIDFEKLVKRALKEEPLYFDLIRYKMAGLQNIEVQQKIEKKYNIKYSIEYISSLYRNKIPKIIADAAKEEYLIYYYTFIEQGKWKKCSRCGEIKLAHNRFFSKNKTSKDGFYSICKKCRNKKN